jgi:hypothetical protein
MHEIKANLLTDSGALFYPFSIILSSFSLQGCIPNKQVNDSNLPTSAHFQKMSFWLNLIKTENPDMTGGKNLCQIFYSRYN